MLFMNHIKVAFCTQNLAPFRMKWVDEMSKELEITVFHLNEYEDDVNKKYISYQPVRVKVEDVSKKVFGKKQYHYNRILSYHPDIVILDGYGFWGQQLLIIKLSFMKIPFILSIDGGFINYGESRLKYYIKQFLVSRADCYFSTCEFTDEFIDYYGGRGKKKYRHYFSNIQKEYLESESINQDKKNAYKSELKIDADFVVVAVGKFIYCKGFDLLLKAIEDIESDIKVLFIGASDIGTYREYINNRNKNKIDFIDFCDQEKLKEYYLAADCMVLPTRGDVWGLVVSEAMANGLPVITTDRCVAGLAMLDREELVTADNYIELREAIVEMINKSYEERMTIGNRNIERTKPYIIENSAKLDVYNLRKYYQSRRNTL